MKKRLSIFVITILTFLFSCQPEKKEAQIVQYTQAPKVLTSGKVVPDDSISPAKTDPAGKLFSFQVKRSIIDLKNTVTFPGQKDEVPAGHSFQASIGSQFFPFPEQNEIVGRVVPCIMPEPLPAQNMRFKDDANYNIQYIDVEQGLPNGYVLSTYEDKDGNIWISGSGPLCRFNGKTFSLFGVENGYVKKRRTRMLTEDKDGNLLCATSVGLIRYDGHNFTYFDDSCGFRSGGVNNILCDQQTGKVWVATSKGLFLMEGNKFTQYTERQGLIDDAVGALFIDSKRNLWIGSASGVSCFDGKTFISYTQEQGLVANGIGSFGEDKTGKIWMASQSGICSFDGKVFARYTDKNGLPSNDVRKMFVNSEGEIWMAIYGKGMCRFDGNSFTTFSHDEGLSLDIIWTVMQDRSGNIWTGTDGGGVCKYTANSFRHFTEKQGMGKTVMSICEDRDSTIWLGSYVSGLYSYNKNGFTSYFSAELGTIRGLMLDQGGVLWMCCEGAGWTRYDGKNFSRYLKTSGLCSNNITCSIQDKDGIYWIGSGDAGLDRFDGKKFTHLTKKQGLCSDGVTCLMKDHLGRLWIGSLEGMTMYDGKKMTRFLPEDGFAKGIRNILEDADGNIWMGTLGNGLLMYDGKAVTDYTTNDGLSDDNIRGLLQDNPSDLPNGMTGLWLSTDSGIDHLLIGKKQFSDTDTIQQEMKIVIYKRDDGLKGEDFCSNAAFHDSKDRLWWGSVKSLVSLDASAVKTKNEIPGIKLNSLMLEQTFVDFRSLKDSIDHHKNYFVGEKKQVNLGRIEFKNVPAFYNYPSGLELPYDINNITFNFSSIDWTAPNKLRYQFTLEGADKEWNPVTAETKAVYTSLPFGKYSFKVRAKGTSDIWSEPFNYDFTIQPPWWKTTWADLAYLLIFLVLTYLMIKWRTRALLARQTELEQEVQLHTYHLRKEKEKVEEKNEIIERKQKEILDSINYAKRLQRSRMATEKYIDNALRRLRRK
ncbi:MAG: two-component regulator propeller domain-containing protein [Bacteroidia bacterium]